MRLSLFSFVFISMLVLGVPAHSAPMPEQTESQGEAYLVRSDTLIAVNPLSVAFRLQDWLGDNGSGNFPPDFSDEDRRSEPWENPPE